MIIEIDEKWALFMSNHTAVCLGVFDTLEDAQAQLTLLIDLHDPAVGR